MRDGGRFGGELKRAGYDGIVVTGASETPVQVRIRDDEVSILPADGTSGEGASGDALWGLDIMETLESIESTEGQGVRALVIEHHDAVVATQEHHMGAAG